MKQIVVLMTFILIFARPSFASEQTVNLVVDYKIVNFTGKNVKALAINQQIPAPTLHFKIGDRVTIRVTNHLDEETAIHWHGMILPWQMDGVKGITQQGIRPGETFTYQFTLKQSGTYWYHAHAGLQEQQGMYGAFLIDPAKTEPYHYTKDEVIVLSDWSNTHPDRILHNLRSDGDYYSPRFPIQPSLAKFIHDYRKASKDERQRLLDDYKMMQEMRMSIYDFSDVAYDAFLLNGETTASPWTAPVKRGDVVRLRFIGAGGSTIFHVKIPDHEMQVVHVDGNDVQPYSVNDFTIAPGETVDVLVSIQTPDPAVIYAESKDTLGAAVGALTQSPQQSIFSVEPFPEPLPVTREMMALMMGTGMSKNHHEHHQEQHTPMKHEMPTEPMIIGDQLSPPSDSYKTSSGTAYDHLKATTKTNDPNKPVANVINMELFGYMERYVWFINGVPEHKAKPLILKANHRYRLVFTNNSMMHHPMHLHGHWFILRKGLGAYDPLLHTIDVPPGATITADIDMDASGQWLFHCHLLYHMMSGMSRVVQYSSLIDIIDQSAMPENISKNTRYHNRPIVRVDRITPMDHHLVHHPMAHEGNWWLSTLLDVGADPFHQSERLSYKGLYGDADKRLELLLKDAEMHEGTVENADLDIFYWHAISQFWAIKGGANYTYRPADNPYWAPGIGIEGLMPYFIETDFRSYFYDGSVKFDLELSRDTQITNNFFIKLGVRSLLATKTVPDAAIGSGLNQMRYIVRPFYRIMPGVKLFAEYEHERDYGVFKTFSDEFSTRDTFTFGATLQF